MLGFLQRLLWLLEQKAVIDWSSIWWFMYNSGTNPTQQSQQHGSFSKELLLLSSRYITAGTRDHWGTTLAKIVLNIFSTNHQCKWACLQYTIPLVWTGLWTMSCRSHHFSRRSLRLNYFKGCSIAKSLIKAAIEYPRNFKTRAFSCI